jgi:3-methyladenine DNA glycosylase Tag
MNDRQLKEIIESMHDTLRAYYHNYGIDIDQQIANDIARSRNNRNGNLFERLVLSIHNSAWKAKSQATWWTKVAPAYEAAFFGYNHPEVQHLSLSDLSDKSLINSNRRLNACLHAARFLCDIEVTGKTPLQFFDGFAYEGASVYERWALVNVLSQSIKGIGTALACDFLKEIGYLNIGKPDVHIKRIMARIGVLSELEKDLVAENDNFLSFRIMDKFAQASGKTVFEVDKIFWLYGSGYNSQGKAIRGICTKNVLQCGTCQLGVNEQCQKITGYQA